MTVSNDGKVKGPTKIFDSKLCLHSIKDIQTGAPIVEITNGTTVTFSSQDSKTLVWNQDQEELYQCYRTKQYQYFGCQMVKEATVKTTFNGVIDFALDEIQLDADNSMFHFNVFTKEKHFENAQKFPSCQKSSSWNKSNVSENLADWIESYSNMEEDEWWYQYNDYEPFGEEPNFEITLPHFANRTGQHHQHLVVFNNHKRILEKQRLDFSNGVLNETVNLAPDAKLQQFVDISVEETVVAAKPDLANTNHNDWKARVQFRMSPKNQGGSTFHVQGAENRFKDFSVLITGQLKESKLHGFVKMYGAVSADPESLCASNIDPILSFIGYFEAGIPSGICWRGLIGGAWLYGQVDANGDFTGSDIAYIYPDMKTAIIGKFVKGMLQSGRETSIVGETCDDRGIKILEFSNPVGPTFRYIRPNATHFGDQPSEPDPLGKRNIEVRPSQNAFGDGVFAIRNLPAMTPFVVYSGLIYTKYDADLLLEKRSKLRETLQTLQMPKQWVDKAAEDLEMNLMTAIGCDKMYVDIPPEHKDKLKSSLGHKVNHSFLPNSKYAYLDSARFGLTPAVFTTRLVSAGEELLVSYGYPLRGAPVWYGLELKKLLQENPDILDEDEDLVNVVGDDILLLDNI